MPKSVVLTFLLVALVAAETRFPTDINELNLLQQNLMPKKRRSTKLSAKDLEDPSKLTQLAARLEKMGYESPKKRRNDKKKRKLLLGNLLHNVNDQFEGIGKLTAPVLGFLGVNNNDRKDYVNVGLGGAALGLGLYQKKHREAEFKRIYSILEHKYHLNNLYLDSIGTQNDNAQFVGKVLSRVLSKVVKTRKAVLAKIHASVNPMS